MDADIDGIMMVGAIEAQLLFEVERHGDVLRKLFVGKWSVSQIFRDGRGGISERA